MNEGGRDPLGSTDRPAAAAATIFGASLDAACRYAALLATDGAEHGLIGPREVPRLWDRHLLNSAVIADLLPVGARIVDVGSGAGLPGIPLAIRRPDLRVDLVEPMLRRTTFLQRVIDELALTERVRVVRGRADDAAVRDTAGNANWVVARAVAPLDRLVRWCLPLLVPGGHLLALKGSGAEAELAEHSAELARFGAVDGRVVEFGRPGFTSTRVICLERSPAVGRNRKERR